MRAAKKKVTQTIFTKYQEDWQDASLIRHPQLKLMKAWGLNELRAKGTSNEVMQNYFTGLGEVMEKYGMNDNPHRIYNVDEFGITPTNVSSKVSRCTYKPFICNCCRTEVTINITANDS